MGNPSLNTKAILPHLFEIVGKEQFKKKFFHLKCKVISPANLSLHEEGVKLFSSFNTQLSFPTNPSHKGKSYQASSP